MGRVLELEKYRRRRTQAYRARFSRHMERFLSRFARERMPCDFEVLRCYYLESRRREHELTWDYLDLRESLAQGLITALGPTIMEELAKEWWFDRRYYLLEEIIDGFLSAYILNRATGSE